MDSAILAVDFGTSNTAAALLDGGLPRRIPVEPGADTLPTAVFFPARGGAMRIGSAAGQALIGGEEGRYMRALKSVLGTPLFHESRLVGGARRTLSDIVTAFLAELRARAEAASGRPLTRVLSGRPVHFHDGAPDRDAQAEADLAACYRAAGFTEVRFLPEPEAAARATRDLSRPGRTGLIVDIGGGTSDFSVFTEGPAGLTIHASHGIRLGGTDFDHALSMAAAMPALGHGGSLRREMGKGLLPVPNAVYVDLATWAKIPFLYTPETRRLAADLAKVAVEPKKLARLVAVLEHELGHELAFAVERGKVAANRDGAAEIRMGFVEPRLAVPLAPGTLDTALAGARDRLGAAALETVAAAGLTPDRIDDIVLVGGSSLMQIVSAEMVARFPAAAQHRANAFTAVVDGLALATAETLPA